MAAERCVSTLPGTGCEGGESDKRNASYLFPGVLVSLVRVAGHSSNMLSHV